MKHIEERIVDATIESHEADANRLWMEINSSVLGRNILKFIVSNPWGNKVVKYAMHKCSSETLRGIKDNMF